MPEIAARIFGDRMPLARRFAELLITDALQRGLIGPREPGRIWTRHLLNCAALADAVPTGAAVVDVGSGAGLPGLVIAIRRPDISVRLVEAQERRTAFLDAAVAALGLRAQVTVLRGRAEDAEIVRAAGSADVVTARAVAPLDRLVRWCLPLLSSTGRLALIRGATAAEELRQHRAAIRRAGGRHARVMPCRVGEAVVPVVLIDREGRP